MSRLRSNRSALLGAAASMLLALPAMGAEDRESAGGDPAAEAVYMQKCASCHDHPTNNIPPRAALAFRSPASVVRSLSDGLMQPMAEGLDAQEIRSLAALLTGREPVPAPDPMANSCEHAAPPVYLAAGDWPVTNGGLQNQRLRSSLSPQQLGKLRQRWAFAIPGGAPGSVVAGGGRLFLATGTGHVMSIDASSGCAHWAWDSGGRLVRRVSLGEVSKGKRVAVFFGDDRGQVTALDASTGELLWQTRIETHPLARITAAPSPHDGRVFVAVSSIEDPLTHRPEHACCTSRGSVAALDAASGKLLWKRYAIAEAPQPIASEDGVQKHSPAGAAIYLPLALDSRRGLVYAATAESYNYDDPIGSYSVIAFDQVSGERKWQRQFIPPSAQRQALCDEIGYTDCRNLFSMGTVVTIHTLADGRQQLVVGQKSGMVYALDPDQQGETLWATRVSRGGDLGGVMYGVAVDGDQIYVPISDAYAQPPHLAGGLVALNGRNGEIQWKVEPFDPQCNWGTQGCEAAQVAATTAVPGAVITGWGDGHLRIYAGADGKPLLDVDTAIEYQAVNGTARGGQVNGFPVTIVGDTVYVVSGAASQARPGNVLLAFTVDGK